MTSPSSNLPPTPDPALIEAWLRGRSMLRGVAQPVPDSGGFRVDTRQRHEDRRYVFVAPVAGLRRLAETIAEPRVFLKLCAGAEAMVPLLPSRWAVQPPGYLMACAGAMRHDPVPLPAGYRLRVARAGGGLHARILAGRAVVASGWAGGWGQVWLYDRIITDEGHRRRGLGRALMAALEAGRPGDATQALVATDEGRALYETLGWAVISPYTTAVIPAG